MAVATRLRELGIEEYLPVANAREISPRNKFPTGPPLFPGYVFSFLNLVTGPRLYNVPGVLRILGYGKQPTHIEDEEIMMVRSIVNSSLPTEPVPYLRYGDKVCLINGPLAGVSGTFVRSLNGNKLVVSLPLLQRSIAVTLPCDSVIAEELVGAVERHFVEVIR
jgi:transcription antitermination factor NusG